MEATAAPTYNFCRNTEEQSLWSHFRQEKIMTVLFPAEDKRQILVDVSRVLLFGEPQNCYSRLNGSSFKVSLS